MSLHKTIVLLSLVFTLVVMETVEEAPTDGANEDFEAKLTHRSGVGHTNVSSMLLENEPSSQGHPDVTSPHTDASMRLPDDLWPFHYNLVQRPDIYTPLNIHSGLLEHSFRFNGRVEIYVLCKTETNKLVVNIKDINIMNDTIEVESLSIFNIAPKFVLSLHDPALQEYAVYFDSFFVRNQTYVIKLDFNGSLASPVTARGFYWSKYVHENKTRIMATTHFSPADARAAFPCLDEPRFKSTFNISIYRRNVTNALSNMPLIRSTVQEDDWILDEFATTPPMSTYITAFIVCDYDHIEVSYDNRVTIRAWTRKDKLSETEYAIMMSRYILAFMEDYTGIKYEISKLDLVSIPDFRVHAMENWGIITFNEVALFYESRDTLTSRLVEVTLVLAHEIAHMWYGNMVTPKTWNQVWLKEGFATYLMHRVIRHLRPHWQADHLYIKQRLWPVMTSEADCDITPLVENIVLPEYLLSVFSKKTYAKGAAVLYMLEGILGVKIFDQSMKEYIHKYQYQSVTMDDLWSTINLVIKKFGTKWKFSSDATTVQEAMNTWTVNPGFPILSADVLEDGSVVISQSHDVISLLSDHFRNESFTWDVPLWINTGPEQMKVSSLWLTKQEEALQLQLPETSYVIVNYNMTTYYEVLYSPELLGRIEKQLLIDHTKIPELSRARLMHDTFSIMRLKKESELPALSVTLYLQRERNFLPWISALKALRIVFAHFAVSPDNHLLKSYMEIILTPIYKLLYWNVFPSHEVISRIQQAVILDTACQMDVLDCRKQAKDSFALWINNDTYWISPDLRSVVFCYGLQETDQATFNKAYQRLHHATSETDISSFIFGLGCIKKSEVIKEFLDQMMTTQELDDVMMLAIMASIARDKPGRDILWQFLQNLWDDLHSPYVNLKGSVLLKIAHYITTTEEHAQLVEFLGNRTAVDEYESHLYQQALITSSSNIHWHQRNFEDITKWLKEILQNQDKPLNKSSTITIYFHIVFLCFVFSFI